MGATDDMIGLVPVVVTAGVVTNLASKMFPNTVKSKTRTVYKTKYVVRKPKKRATKGKFYGTAEQRYEKSQKILAKIKAKKARKASKSAIKKYL